MRVSGGQFADGVHGPSLRPVIDIFISPSLDFMRNDYTTVSPLRSDSPLPSIASGGGHETR